MSNLEKVTLFGIVAYLLGLTIYLYVSLNIFNLSLLISIMSLLSMYSSYQLFNLIYPFLMSSQNKLLKSNSDEYAIITGCTSGLGESLSHCLAKKGYDLLLIARDGTKLNNLILNLKQTNNNCKYLGITHDFGCTNVNVISEFSSYLSNFISNSNITMLINNVGVANNITEEFHNYDIKNDMELIDVNLKSMLMMTKIVLPEMIKDKSNKNKVIINVSSGSAYQASPYISTYGSTKSFMRHFSNSVRKEYEKYGIKVYVCLPLFFLSNIVKEQESILIPKSNVIAEEILKHCYLVNESCPYLPHFIQHIAINCNWVPNLSFKFLQGLYQNRKNKNN